jgi:YVTN family beta-propeller protein
VSPDGKTLFIASENVGQFVADWDGPNPRVTSFTPAQDSDDSRHTNAAAAAFAPDGKTLYWSGGDGGDVYTVDVQKQRVIGSIPLNVNTAGRAFADSYVNDLAVSADGRYLYAADVTNFRVVVIDTQQAQVVASLPVGRYPYALALSGRHLCVANIGLFEYSPIPKPTLPTKPGEIADPRGLTFPPFGFPSREARDGVQMEGRQVPGLGDPMAPEAFSVWDLDVSDPAHPNVLHKIKTGLPIGAQTDSGPAVGGSAPNYLVLRGDALWVSNNNNDSVEQIDLRRGQVVKRVVIRPSPLVSKLRGVGPAGMALSPDGKRLYVTETGINAIGVIDTGAGRVVGHIPSAWYPYRVAVSHDGKRLACVCFRGFGNGPKSSLYRADGLYFGRPLPPQPKPGQAISPYLGMKGALCLPDVPDNAALARMTADVLAYNGIVDHSEDRPKMTSPLVPTTPGVRSEQIKYVVFIAKENHTYDTIFDHVPGANDDATLLRWGYHQTVAAQGQPMLHDVAVMPNHNALVRQFALSDNFYVEPEFSGTGHRWLQGIQPNNFCQMTYTLGWRFKADGTAPGSRASFGSRASIAPEDYPESGSMWEHLARHGKTFRSYGEGFEFAGSVEEDDEAHTGAREVVNIPMSKVLFDNTCRTFPKCNMNIPDQYRAYCFEKDVRENFLSGKTPFPQFIDISICNDHGAPPDAAKGYPYVASWMADGDLALGRIVEFLTHTPYWKNMAIFVTQDDAGGEPDHVDAQRSVLMVISPWTRHGYVSHRHTTIVSMHRTLYELLGLPPLNMFDALANDFSDFFTATPDYTPYTCLPVNPRLFDPKKAIDPKDPDYMAARLRPSPPVDAPDEDDTAEQTTHVGSR